MNRKIKKDYWILLMYAIGRDELDFWSRMEYDLAYQEIVQLRPYFKAYHKHHLTEDFYTVVLSFLRGHLPENTKI